MLLVSYIQQYFNTFTFSITVLTNQWGLKVADCTVQSAESYWCSLRYEVIDAESLIVIFLGHMK